MSVCINHTDRAATQRCSSCHKPICAECVVQSGDALYCSAKCAQGAAQFYSRYKPEKGPGLFGKLATYVGALVGLAVLGAIAVVVGAYVLKNSFCIDLLKKFGL